MKTIQLSKKINVSKGGDFQDVEVLSIEEPSMKNFNHIASLKNVVGKALNEMAKTATDLQDQQEAEESSEKMDSKSMITILTMAGVYDEAVEQFAAFILKFGYVGDDIKLTQTILDEFNPADFEKALGEYFADFLF